MNIIGGKKRGSKLALCTSKAVRPTAQRTREALFNILQGGRFSLSLSEANVIDLFAGTGAIGLEALSRGARSCIFVEQDQDALQTLQANISKLKLENCAHILAKDARQIHSWPGPRAELVFADPPIAAVWQEKFYISLLQQTLSSSRLLLSWKRERLTIVN